MTDALVGVVNLAVSNIDGAREKLSEVSKRQIDVVIELVSGRPDLSDPVIANIKKDHETVSAVLTAVSLTRGVPPQMLEVVAGLGEVWSAQTLAAYLKSTGVEADWVDARDVLIVADTAASSGLGEKGMAMDTIDIFWDETSERLQRWWEDRYGSAGSDGSPAPLLVFTGFVCSTPGGSPTTLKRSGSDYSATIFAKVLGSSRVTMWKNVNGVYTADPRRVPAAFPVERMTFDEAMELAYFGGQVLHPSAMMPCIENRIPVYVRNVFNPSFPGTRVYGRGDSQRRWEDQGSEDDEDERIPVKGVTSIEKVALVTVSGTSFMGTPGVARRMMEALGGAGVNVILASQGSSEHSITVAVDEKDQHIAMDSVRAAFELEMMQNEETDVTLIPEVSIIAVIGEGMKKRPGISGRFLNAFGKAKVNVIAIAQGSSERNISVVVPRADLSRALRAAHDGFTLAAMTIAVAIIGSGMIGTELLRQLAVFQAGADRNDPNLPAMAEVQRLSIEVRAICDKDRMILAEHGIPLGCFQKKAAAGDVFGDDVFDIKKAEATAEDHGKSLKALFVESAEWPENAYETGDTNLESLANFMDTKRLPHRVLIDCTAADEVAEMYPEWLRKGFHVISPNKMGPSGDIARYKKCMAAVAKAQARWHYESTVCGQLPIVSLIHDMIQTGDHVIRIEGLFSGTLSYIFHVLSTRGGEVSFSKAILEARAKGLMEPDMLEDLSGMDTARKVMIVARELGFSLELEDIPVESLVPAAVQSEGGGEISNDGLLEMLREHADDEMAARFSEAAAKGERLQYVGEIDAVTGKAFVGVKSLPLGHPLVTGQDAEVVVSYTTERYPQNTPLVVRGPGAGAVVTASGIFADLLRLSKGLGS